MSDYITGSRSLRLNWNDHHMLLAIITSLRSPDPNTRVGACIVDQSNRVLSLGYNGLPKEINPATFDWNRTNSCKHKTKYPYVIHAESNAIFNANNKNLNDSILYTTMYPCSDCAKQLINTGISTIYYLTNPYKEEDDFIASANLLMMCNKTVLEFRWQDLNFQNYPLFQDYPFMDS